MSDGQIPIDITVERPVCPIHQTTLSKHGMGYGFYCQQCRDDASPPPMAIDLAIALIVRKFEYYSVTHTAQCKCNKTHRRLLATCDCETGQAVKTLSKFVRMWTKQITKAPIDNACLQAYISV